MDDLAGPVALEPDESVVTGSSIASRAEPPAPADGGEERLGPLADAAAPALVRLR